MNSLKMDGVSSTDNRTAHGLCSYRPRFWRKPANESVSAVVVVPWGRSAPVCEQILSGRTLRTAPREDGVPLRRLSFVSLIVCAGVFALMAMTPAQTVRAAQVSKTTYFKSSVSADEVNAVNSKNIKRALSRAAYAGLFLEPLESRMLLAADHGLSASFYNSTIPGTGPGVVNRVDQTVDFYWGTGTPAAGVNSDKFSARWTGQVQPRYSETYTFTTRSDEAVRLWVNGQLIIDAWSRHSLRSDNGTITLQAGKRYDLKMEFYDYSGSATARLMWSSLSQLQEDVPSSQLYAQDPYTNPPATTDMRIEAENYDIGNNGVAYYDTDAGNTAGAYRTDDVDIESTLDKGAGYDIAYQRPGEWLEYSIDVPTSGVFDLDARLAAKASGSSVHFEVDDVNVTGAMAVPGTGSWQAWTTLTTTGISLSAGRHIIKFAEDVANKSGFVSNFNWFQFRRQVPQMTMSTGGNSIANGQSTPIDLGTTQLGNTLPTQTFTVTNAGNGTLTLGTPTLPSGYTLVEGLNSTLAPGTSDTFTIALSGSTRGTYAGTVSITSNDPSASPFTFGVTSRITAPQIAVSYNGGTITSGSSSTIDFGTLQQGDPSRTMVFTVINQGDAPLTLGTPTLPAGFTLVDDLSASIAPGASDTFSIAMTSDVVGDKGGNVGFPTNDPAVSSFVIAVAGSVTQPTTTNNPVLTPGTGFTGPTTEPSPVGNPLAHGFDAKAIARWDVVPYQTFTGAFNVGVVAFHINGIDHVDFSVNGGAWAPVYTMSVNPQTNVNEYWATLHSDNFSDGQLEVRAIVYPKVGVPRVLQGSIDGGLQYTNGNHAMFLSADAGGTLKQPVAYVANDGSDTAGDGTAAHPYATAAFALSKLSSAFGSADGATVYLQAGHYSWGPLSGANPVTSNRWATLTHAPGVDASQVIFDSQSAGGFHTRLIKADGVTVHAAQFKTAGESYLWVSNSVLVGPGTTVDWGFFSETWWSGTYFTSVNVSENRQGIRGATLVRNADVHHISSSPFGDSPLVINSTAEDYDNSGTAFHGDLFHWYFSGSDRENFIVYGVQAHHFGTQGLFAEIVGGNRMDNVAIVNTTIEKNLDNATGSWWEMNTKHLLMWNVNMPDQVFRWAQTTNGTTVADFSIKDSTVWKFSGVFPLDTIFQSLNILSPDSTYPI